MEVLEKRQRLELAVKLGELKGHPFWEKGLLRLAREVKEGILVEMQDANPGDMEIRSADGKVVEIRTFNTRMLLRKGQLEGIDKLFQAFDLLMKELEGKESDDFKKEEKPLPPNLDAEDEDEMEAMAESDLPKVYEEV